MPSGHNKHPYSTSEEEESPDIGETDDDDVILDDIQKEDVIEQLRELGYSDDIPESLVDEFMAEIKKKNASLKTKSSSQIGDITATDDDYDERQQIKKRVAKMQEEDEKEEESPEEEDTDMEKDEESPEEDVPMKKPTSKPSKSTANSDMEFNFSPPKLKPAEKKPKEEISIAQRYTNEKTQQQPYKPLKQQIKEKKLDMTAIQPSMTASSTSSAAARPSSARSTTSRTDSALSSSTASSTYRPKTATLSLSKVKKPVTYRQKVHDPVARFHTMNKTWNKDTFLNSNKTSHSSLRWQVRQEMREIAGDPYLP